MAGRWTAAESATLRQSVIAMCDLQVAHVLVAEAHGISKSRVSRILTRWAPHLRRRPKRVDPERVHSLIGEGLTDAAVAATLGCKPKTISNHRYARGRRT